MSSMTHATQLAVVAAAARPCTWLGGDYGANTSAGMTMSSHTEFVRDIAAKRQARHLGGQPT